MMYSLFTAMLMMVVLGGRDWSNVDCTSFSRKKQCRRRQYYGGKCAWTKLKRGQCIGDTCHPDDHRRRKGSYCVVSPEAPGSDDDAEMNVTDMSISSLNW